MKVKLTKQFMKTGLVCPPGKTHQEYCDTELPGFIADVPATSPGKATFKVRYKNGAGKTAYKTIGRSDVIDLPAARDEARRIKLEVLTGKDYQKEARAKKEVLTWDELWEQRLASYWKTHKRSFRNDERVHRLHLSPRFGNVRLNKITRHAIEQLQQDMLASGRAPSTCNEMLRICRRALNLAMGWDLLPGPNPAARIKAFHEDNQVKRVLSDDELRRLVAVLEKDKNRMVANALLLAAATGARIGEVLHAQWKDIDRNGRTWTVEAQNSKSKRIRRIPLSDAAMRALNSVGTEGRFPYVFVNRHTGERLTTISKVWNRIRAAAGVKDVRIHDLRATFITSLLNSGFSIYTAKEIAGHASVEMTERYSVLAPKTQQDAANVAGDKILEAIDAVV